MFGKKRWLLGSLFSSLVALGLGEWIGAKEDADPVPASSDPVSDKSPLTRATNRAKEIVETTFIPENPFPLKGSQEKKEKPVPLVKFGQPMGILVTPPITLKNFQEAIKSHSTYSFLSPELLPTPQSIRVLTPPTSPSESLPRPEAPKTFFPHSKLFQAVEEERILPNLGNPQPVIIIPLNGPQVVAKKEEEKELPFSLGNPEASRPDQGPDKQNPVAFLPDRDVLPNLPEKNWAVPPNSQPVPPVLPPIGDTETLRNPGNTSNQPNPQGAGPTNVPTGDPKNFVPVTESVVNNRPWFLRERFWFQGENLVWWSSRFPAPALISQGNTAILGQPGTQVLAGGPFDLGTLLGYRFTLGMWLDESHTHAFDGNFFFWASRGKSETFSSNGNPVLGNPYIDALTGNETIHGVANPGGALPALQGSAGYSIQSDLRGGELNYLHNWFRRGNRNHLTTMNIYLGYRSMHFSERLDLFENSTVPLTSLISPGTQYIIGDHFRTTNQFHGVQMGLQWEKRHRVWTGGLTGKLALGDNRQFVSINGHTTTIDPGAGTTTQGAGGIYALTSNSGDRQRHQFSVIPELKAHLGLQVHPRIRVLAGYNFIYWNNIARPGNQIDRVLNTNLIPSTPGVGGPNLPGFQFQNSDFFLHGINLGLEARF